MSYEYCVVWFTRAKSWLDKYPRPIYPECKIFHSLEKAKQFQREFVKPYPNIYRIIKPQSGGGVK